jgi:hypothetical protein
MDIVDHKEFSFSQIIPKNFLLPGKHTISVYQNETLNCTWGKNQRLLWELNETHKYKLYGQSHLLFSVI